VVRAIKLPRSSAPRPSQRPGATITTHILGSPKNTTAVATGTPVNLPAVFISLALTVILVIASRRRRTSNNSLVFVKGGRPRRAPRLRPLVDARPPRSSWRPTGRPFIPAQQRPPSANLFFFFFFIFLFFLLGGSGVFKGSRSDIFDYVGFDTSTPPPGGVKPQRDMPIGLLGCSPSDAQLFIGVIRRGNRMVKDTG